MGKGTILSYNLAWKMWGSLDNRREVDPFSAPTTQILEFLTYLYYERFQYRTINVNRSAIFSVPPHVSNLPIGQHYLVKMKGILTENPPSPRYQDTGDVDIPLRYLLQITKSFH
jgi:hypothetical protein